MKAEIVIPKGWRRVYGKTRLRSGDRYLHAIGVTQWMDIKNCLGLPKNSITAAVVIRRQKKAKHK